MQPSSPADQPPPLPPSLPPVLRRAPRTGRTFALVIGAVLVGAVGFFLVLILPEIRQHSALSKSQPPFRNRPSSGWYRPGQDEFSQADTQIDLNQGTIAFGNTPKAVQLAGDCARFMKAAREQFFTSGFRLSAIASKGEFLTYCELHEQECVFLIHVPELRHYSPEARKTLATIVWTTVQSVLRADGAGKPDMELAVGLRGFSQYGPILLGHYRDQPSATNDGVLLSMDDATKTHFLWTFFAPPAPAR